jgi:hypothetical protein
MLVSFMLDVPSLITAQILYPLEYGTSAAIRLRKLTRAPSQSR